MLNKLIPNYELPQNQTGVVANVTMGATAFFAGSSSILVIVIGITIVIIVFALISHSTRQMGIGLD